MHVVLTYLLLTLKSEHTHPLPLYLNGHFPGEPGLACASISPCWILLQLQSNRHHQQSNTKLFTGRSPSGLPTSNVTALKGKH